MPDVAAIGRLMREYTERIGRPIVEERNTVESSKPVDADRNGYDPDGDIPLP
jgi:hypothetical protein